MKKKSSPHKSMFLAVELEEDLKNKLANRLYLVEEKDNLRIESRRNFHITIGFIPHVHEKHRREVINCFRPLRSLPPFMAYVEEGTILGQYKQILCVKYGPSEPFQKLHETAKSLLQENTEYTFDNKHTDYIPHTKIQSIRKIVKDNKKQSIVQEFLSRNLHKIDFKVKTLALMQRHDKHFEIIYRYVLESVDHHKREVNNFQETES